MKGFVSLWFLLLLVVTLPIYFLVKKPYRWIVLLLSSVVFYALCSYKSIIFLLLTTIVMYFCALAINKNRVKEKEILSTLESIDDKKKIKAKEKKKRKFFLVTGIVLVLLSLSMMKYMNFMIDNTNGIISLFNTDFRFTHVNWFLPLGISFYTFQAIAYLADVYWGKYEPEKNFFKFFLFMSFFPKIMQGPIIRYNEIHDTLFLGNDFEYERFTDGIKRMIWGYFKKLIIADCFVVITTYAFSNVDLLSGVEALLIIIFYFAYDYCDFSGYMDISIGTSKMFGVELPENFNHPYFAIGIDDYWRRWHMTLGTWFKDYIFYPLSISKFSLNLGKKCKKIFKGFAKKIPGIFGLVLVWFITGLWHGASWNFILWGLYFGLLIILSIIFEPLINWFFTKTKWNRKNVFFKIVAHIRVLILLAFGKLLFETTSIPDTLHYIGRIFNADVYFNIENIMNVIGLPSVVVAGLCSVIVLVVDLIQERHPETTFIEKTKKTPLLVQWGMFAFLIVCIVWFGYYGQGLPRFEFGYMRF